MTKITLKLPRKQNTGIYYAGDSNKFINQPIVIENKAIGVITRVINDTDDYVEVEGGLFKAGYDLLKKDMEYIPISIEIK